MKDVSVHLSTGGVISDPTKIPWQGRWRWAAGIAWGCNPSEITLDEEYAKSIVLGGYLDRAWDESEAHYAEFFMRPVMRKEELSYSRSAVLFGEPDRNYKAPADLIEAIKEAEQALIEQEKEEGDE